MNHIVELAQLLILHEGHANITQHVYVWLKAHECAIIEKVSLRLLSLCCSQLSCCIIIISCIILDLETGILPTC